MTRDEARVLILEKMTNEEAAKVLTGIAQEMVDQIKEFKGDGFSEDDLPGIIEGAHISLTAIETALAALQPWVRTADRRPTPKDADAWDLVFATHRAFGGEPYKVRYQVVANNPTDHVWWMPIPPLPEVEG